MKILCKLPNAATEINGVKFVAHELGMISEEIKEEVAAAFLKIEGYIRVRESPSAAAVPPAAPAKEEAASDKDPPASGGTSN